MITRRTETRNEGPRDVHQQKQNTELKGVFRSQRRYDLQPQTNYAIYPIPHSVIIMSKSESKAIQRNTLGNLTGGMWSVCKFATPRFPIRILRCAQTEKMSGMLRVALEFRAIVQLI